MQTRVLSSPGVQLPSLSLFVAPQYSRRCSCIAFAAKKAQRPSNVKVNDRGKVSSRPGTPSRKEMQRRAEEAKLLQQQQQQEQQQSSPEATESQAQQQQQQQQPPPSATSPPPRAAVATPATQRLPPAVAASSPAPPLQETPQVVVDRMFGRMLSFAGVPVFLGIATLPVFYYFKVKQHVDLPMWTVYITQLLTFGGGLFGITYGVLSTSWDPKREGSFWGWTELQANLPILLKRNQDKQ